MLYVDGTGEIDISIVTLEISNASSGEPSNEPSDGSDRADETLPAERERSRELQYETLGLWYPGIRNCATAGSVRARCFLTPLLLESKEYLRRKVYAMRHGHFRVLVPNITRIAILRT